GADVRVTVPVTFPEAVLGAEVEAPTPDGGRVRLRAPPGTAARPTPRVGRPPPGPRPIPRAGSRSPGCVTPEWAMPGDTGGAERRQPGRRGWREREPQSGTGDWGAGPDLTLDPEAPIFVISVAAQLAGMHPQTLRQYDRLGL